MPRTWDVPPSPPLIQFHYPSQPPQHLRRVRTNPQVHFCKITELSSPFLKKQTKLEGRVWQASCFLSGVLELEEPRCILMASSWTEIRILVAEAGLALL